jgi:Ulp1 family protease
MTTRTNVHLNQHDVVSYFVKTMIHYKDDKEMLVIPFNTDNHWVTILISTKYDQIWYCDSSRPIDPRTDD